MRRTDILLPMGDLVCRVVDLGDRRLVTVDAGEYAPRYSERLRGEGRRLPAGAAGA
jgi:hypothetical protein